MNDRPQTAQTESDIPAERSKSDIFRKEALDRLSSPEQLDQSLRLVRPLDWLLLTGLGTLVTFAVGWSIFGKIPVTVTGRGVLIRPRRVVQLQSPISGQLESVNVRDGQCIQKDYVLATIHPAPLLKQLELQQGKLARLQLQATDSKALQERRTAVELAALAAKRRSLLQRLEDAKALTPILQQYTIKALSEQRLSLEQRLAGAIAVTPLLKEQKLAAIALFRASLGRRLADAKALTPELQDKGTRAIAQQRESLQQRLQDAQELVPVFQLRMETRRELFKAGAIAQDSLLQTEADYRQNLQEIGQIKAELKQLEVQETDLRERYLQNLNSMAEIEMQMQELALEETEARERDLEKINQIQEIQVQLQEIKVKETEARQKYLENLSQISQLEADLQELATQRKRWEQDNLEADNRRQNIIEEVEREIARLEKEIAENSKIESSQGGCVLEIKAGVGQYVNAGTSLGTINTSGKTVEMLGVTYLNIKDGKRVKPGMSIQITPDNVKRERFGGIVGKITSVSEFPVTREGANFVVGNPEIVQTIMGEEGGKIEVMARLQPDSHTSTGYKWSSSAGPDLEITTGTTTIARVTVEERSPLSFVLPIIREWTGI